MIDNEETEPTAPVFDVTAYPKDALFHERRSRADRREIHSTGEAVEPARPRRARTVRRKRVDPTTFEKQYTGDEIEFMNAMQQYKTQSGKVFPTHGDTLRVAFELGYRQVQKGVSHPARPQVAQDDAQGTEG